jgi:hypothetical protein
VERSARDRSYKLNECRAAGGEKQSEEANSSLQLRVAITAGIQQNTITGFHYKISVIVLLLFTDRVVV